MISLFNVRTVARYEAKTLLRSWFFRIFAAIALLFLLFFNLFAVAAIGDGAWQGRLIPSAVPYFNMWILNIAQSIIAVFLSADFLGRDKKLDTAESFYVRSMSNIEYVMGKTLGILKVFVVLNSIVLLFGMVFTLVGNEVAVNWSSYVLYPLLVSLPTLVFVLGLSFFVMTLIRNQAVTFVLLLGFIALSLFYLRNKWFGVMDFLGFYMPFMRSDLTGFGNEGDLMMVRPAFLLLGIFFIMATIWRLPRLEQQKLAKPLVLIIMIGALTGAVAMMGVKGLGDYSGRELRAEINRLNTGLQASACRIQSYHIKLNHSGKTISCHCAMEMHGGEATGELVLALNPGLKVKRVLLNNKEAAFKREAHLVKVDKAGLGQADFTLTIEYSGDIDNNAMFPEVSVDALLELDRVDPLVRNKQFSFLEENYVLLTREANWYPVVASKLYWTSYPFTHMYLEVKTSERLTALSQGEARSDDKGGWVFTPEEKLNAYSLVIGEYNKISTMVDSVEFSYYSSVGHDYYQSYFKEIADTSAFIIKNIKNDFERKLGSSYPFKRFAIVESPVNMHSYLRNWSLATENIMPEMVFFPEMGGGTWENDLARQKKRMERDRKRNNEEISDREILVDIFKTFVGDNFIQPRRFFFGRQQGGERSVENWGRYQIFPLYFTYTNAIREEGYPLMTIALENYLHQRLGEQAGRPPMGGLSTNDEVILKLRNSSLDELIQKEDVNVLGNVFASKGNQLITGLKVHADPGRFDRSLDRLIRQNRFEDITLEALSPQLDRLANTDFMTVYANWLKDQYNAAFIFGSVSVAEIQEGNRMRYFVKVPVANYGEADGLISFTIREGERQGGRRGRFRSRFMSGGDQTENAVSYTIPRSQSLDIGFLLDDVPRDITVNTYLASNIPSTQRLETGDVIREQRRVDYFEGPRPSRIKMNFLAAGELIVDNEDSGFSYVNTGESRTIKDWWVSRQNQEDDDETYGMVRFWNSPIKWKPVVSENMFGEYIKSAYYKRSGSGDGFASWSADIENAGNYDVYVYVPDIGGGWRRGRNYNRDYHYTVDHDDGKDEVAVEVTQDNNGWLYLGEYYFSEGSATVQLSDMSKGEYVIADAVKWVKK